MKPVCCVLLVGCGNNQNLLIRRLHYDLKNPKTNMKIKSILQQFTLILLSLLLTFTSASAQTPAYANGDLLLGFRATGTPGSTETYLVNIGQAAIYRDATGAITLNSIGDIEADLIATFGNNWFDREDLYWGIVGGVFPAASGDGNNTLYATLQQVPFGTATDPLDRRAGSQQSSTNSQITGLKNSFVSGNYSVTANSSVAAIIPTSDANSWEDFNDGTLSFNTWNGGIEGSFANSAEGTALDLHRMATSIVPGLNGTCEGTFTITDNGVITFTPAAAVSFENASYTVNEADGTLSINVIRAGGLSNAFTVNFNTVAGTALAGNDFTGQTGTLVSFAASDTMETVVVNIADIPGFQGNRTFTLTLTSASSGGSIITPSTATVTIEDDDTEPAGEIEFTDAEFDFNALDNGSPANIAVTLIRTAGTAGAVSVNVSSTGGTLVSGTDYTALSIPTTVNFADGVTEAVVNIQLHAIDSADIPGTIELELSSPTGGATLGVQTTTIANILSRGSVAFSSTTYQGSESFAGDTTVTITATRTGGDNGAVTANVVSVVGGTATNVTDYVIPAGPSFSWADGEAGDKTIVITIKTDAIVEAGGETIFIALQNLTGGVSAGTPGSATVTINDAVIPDSTAPTVTLTAPKAGSKSSGTSLLFTGTAGDNNVVDRVEVVLNGGAAQDATLVVAGATATWSLTTTPENGINTVVVTAYDQQNNASISVNRSFTFTSVRPEFAGKYNGLLTATDGNSDHHGLLALAVSPTGTFTGKLSISGVVVKIGGIILNDGSAMFGKAPALSSSFAVTKKVSGVVTTIGHLALTLNTTPGVDKVTGTLKTNANDDDNDAIGEIDADRALYVSKNPPVAPFLNVPTTILDPLTNKGKYTAIFQPTANGGMPANLFPQGIGHGTITVSKAGVAKIVGKLADGSPISYSNALSKTNQWPVYIALYKKSGIIAGQVAFQNLAESDADCEDMVWFKPANVADKLYPAGWASGITVDFFASKFVNNPAISGKNALDAAGVIAPTVNAALDIASGLLTGTIERDASVATNSKVTMVPSVTPDPEKVKLTISHGAGTISGSFIHSVSLKPTPFTGVVFQKTNSAYGYFIGKSAGNVTPWAGGSVTVEIVP